MPSSEYDKLSPFEFKDTLIAKAQSHSDHTMLNAGRGNPNFLATHPRYAFLRIGEFAMQESERSYSYLSSGFGGMPEKTGIDARFDTFVLMNKSQPGINFLTAACAFAQDHMGINKADLLHEMTLAFLGCQYATPPRMLTITEQVVRAYLSAELCGTNIGAEQFDVFATEGATASMAYLFHSLSIASLLNKGDKVAIITPIFSPYLEIPRVPEFDLEIIDIKASEQHDWQVPDSELDKLLDPDVKLLFMVNPSNPPSVKMNQHFLNKLADIVNTKRQDLMVVSDDVYATFADDYRSLFSACPFNTLCVYSFSKYFGVTGWRLGTMMLHEKNVFDELLKNISETDKKRLDERYASLTDTPRELKFIDRLVADSRSVALNHTAGLSLPQQLQMMLLAFNNLLDENQDYKKEAKRIVRRRYNLLYDTIGAKPQNDSNTVGYYTLLDLEDLSAQLYSKQFSTWLIDNIACADFLLRLADETSVVLLPGKGFDVDHPSARVSLANLTEHDYQSIGCCVKQLLSEYFQQFSQK